MEKKRAPRRERAVAAEHDQPDRRILSGVVGQRPDESPCALDALGEVVMQQIDLVLAFGRVWEACFQRFSIAGSNTDHW
jgi:hypothetical protein